MNSWAADVSLGWSVQRDVGQVWLACGASGLPVGRLAAYLKAAALARFRAVGRKAVVCGYIYLYIRVGGLGRQLGQGVGGGFFLGLFVAALGVR